jgi:hypothetical protein
LVSVGCDRDEFLGGAHGAKLYDETNMELPSGRLLSLDDVVVKSPAARRTLRKLCDAALERDAVRADAGPAYSLGNDAVDAGETTSPPLHFFHFVFTPRGLRFVFVEQLPFAIADAVVPEVPYADLAPILTPGSPAARVSPSIPHVTADAPRE